MPLRVLQLGPYPPPEGGISRNMLAIREELLTRGHSCSIVATSRSNSVTDEKDVYHPRSAFALLRLLSSLKFDVLHLHVGGDVTRRVLTLAAACSLFARNKGVLTLHSGAYPLTEEAKTASPNSIRGRVFRRFSRIVAVNEAIADVFRRYGVPADRINVILPYSLRRPDERVAVPEELARFFNQHSPILLSVGGLEKDYDPLFQINAMKDISAKFPNAGLMIVGDGSMRDEVENAVGESGYAESVHLAGNVEHAVTLHLINDADILLRTTLFDGDAISVREALFLGTPVIATETAERPDGVYLIGAGDRAALLERLRSALGLGEGKPPFQSVHADSTNIASVIDLYSKLAS